MEMSREELQNHIDKLRDALKMLPSDEAYELPREGLTDLGLRENLKDKPDARALRGPNAPFLAPEILDGGGSPASDSYSTAPRE